jgi:outer membrane protein assembly factor BamD
MRQAKLSGVRSWALLGAATLLAACSGLPQDDTVNWSTEKIYAAAKELAAAGSYEKAVTMFDTLEGRAAGTVLAQQAQLEKAYTQFKLGDTSQASATLDRFMRLHPSSEAIDYALYLKGVIDFNGDWGPLMSLTRQNLAERDQQAARRSFESLKALSTRFPNSRYAPDARLRMAYIVKVLAQNEMLIARYYYKRGAYVAALNRAQATLTDYPHSDATEEALFILMKSYEALDMPQLRDDAQRVLSHNYPNSEFLRKGFLAKSSAPWWKLW